MAALVLAVGLLAAGGAWAQRAQPQARPDRDQPIEITADRLEVQQDKQQATFSGAVEAVQGELRIKADKLVVHYRQAGSTLRPPGSAPPAQPRSASAPAPQGALTPAPQGALTPAPQGALTPAPQGAMGAISRIEASGNVHLISPSETAAGQTGVYDVTAGTAVLTGQVTLTRDRNVLKGERLVMNLNTGVSQLDGAATAGAGGGRVRGVFVPQNEPAGTRR